MKHIKLFEDYSDEELGDLIGDLRGIGHHDLKFNVRSDAMYKKERDREEEFSRNYKGDVALLSVDGEMGSHFLADLHLVLSNGVKIDLTIPTYAGWGSPELLITGDGFDGNTNYANQFFKYGPQEVTYTESLMKFYNELRK
jgi:hypothetical protein